MFVCSFSVFNCCSFVKLFYSALTIGVFEFVFGGVCVRWVLLCWVFFEFGYTINRQQGLVWWLMSFNKNEAIFCSRVAV